MKGRKGKSLGITISQKDQIENIRYSLVRQIMQIGSIWLVMVAIYVGILSRLKVQIDRSILYGGTLIIIAVLVLFYSNCKRKWIVFVSGTLLYGMVSMIEFTKINNGLGKLIELYFELRNQYFTNNRGMSALFYYGIDNDKTEMSVALLMVFTLFILLFFLIQYYNKGKIIAAMLMLVPTAIATSIGELPSGSACWFLILTAIIYMTIAVKKESKTLWKQGIAALVFGGIAIFLAVLLQGPIVKARKEKEEDYYKVKHTLQNEFSQTFKNISNEIRWDGNFANAGVGDGNLKDLSNNRATGKIDLEVTLNRKPVSAVYLRGYVGTKYTGDAWETQEKEWKEFEKTLKRKDPLWQIYNLPYNQMKSLIENINEMSLTIEVLGGSKNYTYMGYLSPLEEGMDLIADGTVKGTRKKEYTRKIIPYDKIPRLMEYGKKAGKNKKEIQMLDLFQQYEDYVYEQYTTVPDNLDQLEKLTQWYTFAGGLGKEYEDVEFLGFTIDDILRESKYSLTPGKKPEDIDFAEYFLFHNKKGFCVHYATTAALLYRMWGIPARYVSGYAIAPSSFKLQKDGTYKAKVKDSMAHAWVETYAKNLGWVIKEHTTGGYQSINEEYYNHDEFWNMHNEKANKEQAAEVAANPKANPKEEPKKEEPVKEEEKKQELGSGKRKYDATYYLILVLEIVCVVLVLLSIFILQGILRKKRRVKSFYIQKENIGICELYKGIYHIGILAGMKKQDPLSKEILEAFIHTFDEIDKETWYMVHEYTIKAMYSPYILTKEEINQMYEIYKLVVKEGKKKMKWYQKIKLNYINCYG